MRRYDLGDMTWYPHMLTQGINPLGVLTNSIIVQGKVTVTDSNGHCYDVRGDDANTMVGVRVTMQGVARHGWTTILPVLLTAAGCALTLLVDGW